MCVMIDYLTEVATGQGMTIQHLSKCYDHVIEGFVVEHLAFDLVV